MVMTMTVNMSLALCVHAEVMAGKFPDGNDETMNMSRAAQHSAVQLSAHPYAARTALGAALCVDAEVMAGGFPDGNDDDNKHVPGCRAWCCSVVCPAGARHLLQSQALLALSAQLEPGTCCSGRLSWLRLPSWSQAPAAVAGSPGSVCPAGARHLLQSQALLALSRASVLNVEAD